MKKGNGSMCAASNRSRERENKNENRDLISDTSILEIKKQRIDKL